MATSSITKTFEIKDKKTCRRLMRILNKPAPPIPETHYLEEGQKLFKQYFGR